MKVEIPGEVREIGTALGNAGFNAYLVGGCVRDLFLDREPQDWDITTDAKPEEIQKVFPESVYENRFGTVGVKTGSEDPRLRIVEVTTFRKEGAYTDRRHPDSVDFTSSVEEDLARRDFTINAMALDVKGANASKKADLSVVDPFEGMKDIEEGVVRAVGGPEERFSEDALRLMRAVRFSVELGFEIEHDTRGAIAKLSGLLEAVAKERIRDEFAKIVMSPHASRGIILLEELGLLRTVVPELREGIGVDQNLHHIYTVFEHSVRALDYSAKEDHVLEVRLAALLHDVGKPRTKRGEGKTATFHGHEVVGARMAVKILDRLKFPKEIVEYVAHLVRWHMFYYNVGEVSAAGVRRFLARVGPENVGDLVRVREADRIGSGVPKAAPYKIRHLLFMIEKVKHDPVSPKMLAVRGEDVMRIVGIPPGPRVGHILAVLLEEVLDDPSRNEKDILEPRVTELAKFSDRELVALAKKARERKEEFEEGVEEEMKEKHKVK